MENIYKIVLDVILISIRKRLKHASILLLSFLLVSTSTMAQAQQTIKGQILDQKKQPLIGATVIFKYLKTKGTITDLDGNFSLNLPAEGFQPGKQVIVVSSVGFKTQEVDFSKSNPINIVMEENNNMVNEVVVVGYGTQKKESLIGAITQTKGDLLEKSGGVSSLGATLTGKLPGVITVASSGAPGGEDPKIFIRGSSSWNNSDPLVLVDGIERPMNSVDISSVESISVLKDASATAVFGVKGGNGVILITTKRGKEGKADIRVSLNSTIKMPSNLATKYDSYDALSIRNTAIERELGVAPGGWAKTMPTDMLNKYRNPANAAEAERYPNINWQDELVKKYTTSQNASINISGGTPNVKYFTSVDYLREGDILRVQENNKSYTPGFGYNRFNVRSNLDINITKSTVLSANLSGSYGVKQDTYNQDAWEYRIWQSIYSNPPDVYMPRYSNGSWGYYDEKKVSALNSVATLANNGIRKTTTENINTDFTLKQDLGMLVSGLTAKASLAYDNTFKNVGGIFDDGTVLQGYINPQTGEVTYSQFLKQSSKFDWIPTRWSTRADEDYKNQWNQSETFRKMFYQFQIDYAKKIGKNDFTVMGMFSRDQFATGSEFVNFREDWVSRVTYNYAGKYFAEANGAFNGTEKFGPQNRFSFFPSVGFGWTISEESFMKKIKFLDMLKVRGSWGQVGNDFTNYKRWVYMDQWEYGKNASLGVNSGTSPYTQWRISTVGNPDIHWEKVTKTNIGIDYAFLNGFVSGSVEMFREYRTDILLLGSQRAIPSYFGAEPAMSNIGIVSNRGYEITVRVNKQLNKNWRVWADFAMSHTKNKIVEADDAVAKDDHLKRAGKSINQNSSYIPQGYYNNWDQVYGSTQLDGGDNQKMPGGLYIADYNADGVINFKDRAPCGYTEVPQNTYNATLGVEWKNLSFFIQFYGVNNASRYLELRSFGDNLDNVYKQGSYWSKTNTNADVPVPGWNTKNDYYSGSTLYLYDGSYIRLKNVEIAYVFKEPWVKKLGMSNLRIFANGDNLLLWTKLPDDREVNDNKSTAYPTVKRVNFGLNVNF